MSLDCVGRKRRRPHPPQHMAEASLQLPFLLDKQRDEVIASKEVTNHVLVTSKKGLQKHPICQRQSSIIYKGWKYHGKKERMKIEFTTTVVPFCLIDNESASLLTIIDFSLLLKLGLIKFTILKNLSKN